MDFCKAKLWNWRYSCVSGPLIGSCSIIFSLLCNHFRLTRSWPGSGLDRICSGYILVMDQFLPVPNCACATQPDICTYACPGSICHPVTLLTTRTPAASITANVLCVICTFRSSSLPVPATVMEFHAERIHSADPHQRCACEMTGCVPLPPLHSGVLVPWPKLVPQCYCQEFPWELVHALWIWSLPLIKPLSNSF